MSGTGFGLSRIGQVYVTAHDLERAVAFYRDVLGVRFLFQVPKMAFFDCAGTRLMLGVPESAEFDHPASILYFDVGDIAAAHETLKQRGVEFREAPARIADLGDRVLWLASFRDSEGNAMALMSEVPKRAAL
ncbi:MAG: VOC family protein [Gemmatimonadetes bacterium]|nr:VOC family protein [Gemmatimonadota bacterium]